MLLIRTTGRPASKHSNRHWKRSPRVRVGVALGCRSPNRSVPTCNNLCLLAALAEEAEALPEVLQTSDPALLADHLAILFPFAEGRLQLGCALHYKISMPHACDAWERQTLIILHHPMQAKVIRCSCGGTECRGHALGDAGTLPQWRPRRQACASTAAGSSRRVQSAPDRHCRARCCGFSPPPSKCHPHSMPARPARHAPHFLLFRM